jgi:hypothetical protein
MEDKMRISRLAKGVGSIVAGGVLAGLVGGMALGSFATGGHKGGGPDPLMFAEQVGNPHAAYGEDGAQNVAYSAYDLAGGPPMAEVRCKGCGPGINDRMSPQYAYGYDDPAVQAYLNYRPLPPLTTAALEAEVAAGRPAPSLAPPVAEEPKPIVRPVTPPADPAVLSAAELGG